MYLFPVTAVTGYHKFSDLPPPSNTKVALLVKILLAKAGEAYSIPGSGRSPGGGHGNPLQYSCLENLMDRGAWRTTVHRVSKCWTRLKRLSTQTTQIFFPFIFISWRLITLQYCSGFCHALTWISHEFTCVPHPDPPSHLPNNTNLFILQFWRKWVIWGLNQGVGRLVSLCSLQGSGQESSSSPFPASRGTHSP